MKTTKQAASDYAEITNVLTGIPCSDVEEIFLSGAEFANRWIPVNEELPEIGDIVLLKYDNTDYMVSTGSYKSEKFSPDFSFRESEITHWKPIN